MTNKIAESIRSLLRETTPDLTAEEVTAAAELLDHGEWGEAFDLICTQLYEHGVSISSARYAAIEQTGTMMGVRSDGWSFLEELVS